MENETTLFGIPVPSDNTVFLAILTVHIGLGIVCVVAGLVAMLSNKIQKLHPKAGKIYHWAMVFVFITIVILSIMRWPFNIHLLIVGTLAFLFSYFGRRVAQSHKKGWTRLHTLFMGSSYIFLLTGFYVDNGKNLPFWNQFSELFFYIFPAAVGLPIIIYVLLRHPLNRSVRKK